MIKPELYYKNDSEWRTWLSQNYKSFAPSYRKSYLYWLNQAKKTETRAKRIDQIISLCKANKKSR